MEEAIIVVSSSWKEIIVATITIAFFTYIQYRFETRKYRKGE